ncbi:MAG: hypothetical protein CL824_02585 [Crocinitomicaceae bacterium]|nr:hypothetical protein [Crocinitomicaceae bacterium]|tara:strand:- start:884 stop:1414 length:531 start_codon:yes stop_codon:yes gene_type:complete
MKSKIFRGEKILIRPVNINDLTLLYVWENNPENKLFTHVDLPISIFQIQELIENQSDIFKYNQMRFIICDVSNNTPLGTIDLYNVDFQIKTAEIGVLIVDPLNRRKGFANESIELVKDFCLNTLALKKLYCFISEDNLISQSLFSKNSFIMKKKPDCIHSKSLNNDLSFKYFELCF